MLEVINKDITTIEDGVIVHQVNCMGKMGLGVAGQLRKKYPMIYSEYISLVDSHKNNKELLLGSVQVIPINHRLCVVNAFTQYNYGHGPRTHTNYNAIIRAFKLINNIDSEVKVHIPYKYGCGLGGGDWNLVQKLISEIRPSVIVCKRDQDT